MKNNLWPLAVLLGIIAIALFGGVKNSIILNQSGNPIPPPSQRQLTQDEISYQLQNTQYQTEQLKQKLAAEQEAKIASQYKNQITMTWGSYSATEPNQEYLIIEANYNNKNPIKITGWQIKSGLTGQIIKLPQSTALYFSNINNSDEDVWLSPGEKAYIISGRSPIGYGMHTNICSGYLAQSNNFTPGLYTQCPLPKDESSAYISHTPNNNTCFDLINSLSSCYVYPKALDNTYSYECQQFVSTKLNYQSCAERHKNDSNFYSPKIWYIYLKHDQIIWQKKYEVVTLYDQFGKKISTITN